MKKWKATVLLTIVLVITAILTAMSFARFPIGTKDFNGFLGAIQTDYDISGGTAYTFTLAKDNIKDVEDVNEVIDVLKYRLNLLGYQSYSVKAIKDVDQAVTDYDIRIEARGSVNEFGVIDTATLTSDMQVVAAYGELEFYGGTESSPSERILKDDKVVSDAVYAGTYADGSTTYYLVNITFTDYGYNGLMTLLKNNSDSYYLKITLGDTVLMSGTSAVSASYFSGKNLQINTTSEAGAKQAALQIKSGGLAYKYELDSDSINEIVSPFGENVATKCVIALAALVAAVIVYAFVINKKYGVVALLSALLFVDLYLFMLIAIPSIKISVGGIVGFALATVLTADGFYIVSKRIKEEFGRGKTLKSAVKAGFNRSAVSVVGTAGISIVVSLILLAFTTGVVANFATVFAIGAAVSVVTTMLFARMFSGLILPLVEYKESFLGLKRTDADAFAGEKGE